MSKEHFLKEFIRTKLSEAGMSSKFRKAVEEYKEVSLKLQDLFADRAKALEGYKKASGDEKEKYKAELSRIQKLVTPLQNQMEKAERVFNKALLSEPEELEEGKNTQAYIVVKRVANTKEEVVVSNESFERLMKGKDVVGVVVSGVGRGEEVWVSKMDVVSYRPTFDQKLISLVFENTVELEEGNDDGLERVASGLPQTEEEPDGLEEKLNPEAGEWVLYKPMGAFKKKFVSIHKSHKSAQMAMKKALDTMNRSGEDGGYGIMSKDKWDKEKYIVESVSEASSKTEISNVLKNAKASSKRSGYENYVYLDKLGDVSFARKAEFERFADKKDLKLMYKVDGDSVTKVKSVSEGKHDKEIKALEDKIKAVKGKTPADLGRKAAMQDDLERLKAMNEGYSNATKLELQQYLINLNTELSGEKDPKKIKLIKGDIEDVKKELQKRSNSKKESVNEVSRRAKEMFDDTKFGQEIHKMLKGKWDAKKVEDYLDGQGGEDTQKHLRIIDFISKSAGLNPRKYDNQTLGKHISDLVDKLEVLYTDFTKGTDVKKFDDVHIKSKNLTGIVYAISGNTLIVKTASGMVKTTKDDVEVVMSDSVIKEGNAFGMAVTQAKKEGKKEFEFNGKTYKVKKGKGKVNESDCGCGSKVVVGEGQNETDALDKIAKFETYLRYIANDDKYKPLVSRVRNEIDRLKKDLKKNESVNEAVKEPEVIAKIRDIVKKHQHASVKDPKLGKMIKVDGFSASAIIQVYDAINDTNKAKFAAMSIPKMAEVAFKLVKK